MNELGLYKLAWSSFSCTAVLHTLILFYALSMQAECLGEPRVPVDLQQCPPASSCVSQAFLSLFINCRFTFAVSRWQNLRC